MASTEPTKIRSATARVSVTIEMDAGGSWDGDCTLAQVRRQTIVAVEDALRGGLIINGLSCQGFTKTPAKIVGEPHVTVIVIEEGE